MGYGFPMKAQPTQVALTDAIDNLLKSVDGALMSPVANAISEFSVHNEIVLVLIITLFLVLMGVKGWRDELDSGVLAKTGLCLVFSVAFYRYLPYTSAQLINILFNGPSYLTEVFTDLGPASGAAGLGNPLTAGFSMVADMLNQNGVRFLQKDWGIWAMGVMVAFIAVVFAAVSLGLIIVHKLRLQVMIIILPFMLALYLFAQHRKIVDRYIQIILTSMLALLLFSFLGVMIALAGVLPSEVKTLLAAALIAMVMAVMVILVKAINKLAITIGGSYQSNSGNFDMGSSVKGLIGLFNIKSGAPREG